LKNLSVILMASNPVTLPDALDSILAVVPDYSELVVGVAPNLPLVARRLLETVPRVRLLPGTNDIDEAGRVRFRLLDECSSEWILNCDDDDLLTFLPTVDDLARKTAHIFGDCIFLVPFAVGPFKAGYCTVLKGGPIHHPSEAYHAAGSAWLIRREAWQQVSPLIDRSYFWFSDFRIIFWLLRLGWKIKYIPRLMGIVRVLKWNYPEGPEWLWSNFVKSLEAQHQT